MRLSRREVLLHSLLGSGYLGLRALCTGLPVAILADARMARADGEPECPDRQAAQYLILSASTDGDPLNANTPGTYELPEIVHPSDPQMAPQKLSLGGRQVTAAKPWAGLPQKILDRTCFFHHATRHNGHPNLPDVMRLLLGSQAEMLPSIIARHTSGCLGTAQREPLVLGGEAVYSFESRKLPSLKPTLLRDVLNGQGSPLADLGKVRDETLDKLQATLKERGQKALRGEIDDRALSKRQAQQLGEQIRADLSAITSDASDGQVLAAAVLVRLAVSPVIAVRIGFGGDNHFDYGLKRETEGTVSGVARIAQLMQKLGQYGLADRVTFAAINVFGRTLKKRGIAGREHWANHSTAVLIGKGFRGGVIGGVSPGEGDVCALPINSQSGGGEPSGDIPVAESLASLGKTLARGMGLPPAVIDKSIPQGKIVRSVLVKP
jgi:hypothetical protein